MNSISQVIELWENTMISSSFSSYNVIEELKNNDIFSTLTICPQGNNCTFLNEKISNKSVIVGMFALDNGAVNVNIGGYDVLSHPVVAGKFKYWFDNNNLLCLQNIQNHDVRIVTNVPIILIYAILDVSSYKFEYYKGDDKYEVSNNMLNHTSIYSSLFATTNA